jgi:NAD(P)H dehydrogenase (quinone)
MDSIIMNVFIVYWHPEPKSFNGAMFQTACETLVASGHTVVISDLHEMNFNPVSGRQNFLLNNDPKYLKLQAEEMYASEHHGFIAEIESEIQKIENCDLMIWQFPLWWFGLPAALKGWVERTFAMGRVYGGGRVYNKGVFKGKRALLSITTGGPETAYRKDGIHGDMAGVLRPIQRGILQFVGFDVLAPQIVFGPAHLTVEEREKHLAMYAERLRNIDREQSVEVGTY